MLVVVLGTSQSTEIELQRWEAHILQVGHRDMPEILSWVMFRWFNFIKVAVKQKHIDSI